MKREIEFTPDEWLTVRAKDEKAAREIFGAPPDWPCKFVKFDIERGGRIYKVLASGLTI